jgi:hypothetical protein
MQRLVKLLASTRLTVVLLLLLGVLVVWGTLYQAEHGLYLAQKKFYQSFLFLAMGWLPFPGTQLVLFVLFLNLVTSMFVTLRYGWRRAGSVITHAGLLVFLVGGFVIGLFAEESTLTLEEGEGSNLASSREVWEVAVWRRGEGVADGEHHPRQRPVQAVTVAVPLSGKVYRYAQPDITLTVESYYPNAAPAGHAHDVEPDAGPVPANSSGFKALSPRPREKDPAADIPGLVLRVAHGERDLGRVLLFGADRQPTQIEIDGTPYELALRRKRSQLPFTVILDDFQREMHPNSGMAKSYASEVTLLADGVERRVRIAMNEPLRHRGFTLFQSSYREMAGGREFSTFAVVSNRGRYLPYVGTFVVFGGLMLHFLTVVRTKQARES